MKQSVEVADTFRSYRNQYEQKFGTDHPEVIAKVIDDITSCRTARLGGHKERCENCGHQRISYNSCRNRHCPKCQFLSKEQWIRDRTAEVLPIQYFHVVFTVADSLALLMYRNQKKLYTLLLRCAGQTISELGKDQRYLGANTGAICVLHTWGCEIAAAPSRSHYRARWRS